MTECLVLIFVVVVIVVPQVKVKEYVLDENDQLMPMNRLHGENTVRKRFTQESMSRSEQLPIIPVTAFSQTDSFLD